MNWNGVWHLGTRYLRRKRVKTGLLIAAFTLVWLLPTLLNIFIKQAEQHLADRAESTPLLVGRSGSPLELVFNGLYFTKPALATFPLGESDKLVDNVNAIPIYARFSADGHRIVGTYPDYFNFRKLDFSAGRSFLRLGECVVGSKLAKSLNIKVDDSVITDPGSMFDIAGVYPLKLNICGVLSETGTADDSAFFVDLKTAWIIEGLGHGHDDAVEIGESGVLSKQGNQIRLNASIEKFNEITAENAGDFHFHGSMTDFPITALIAIPGDAKAQALLKGRYQSRNDMQIIEPQQEMDELFSTIFRIQSFVTSVLTMVGLATLVMGCLVFMLSYRLRIHEFENLSNMGADSGFLKLLIGFEALFVLVSSLVLAVIISLAASAIAPGVIRMALN